MFPCAIPHQRADYLRVTHPSATSGPEGPFVRLACLRRAASVRSEPGSNSPLWISLYRSTELSTVQSVSISRTRLLYSNPPRSLELTGALCSKSFSLFPFVSSTKNPCASPGLFSPVSTRLEYLTLFTHKWEVPFLSFLQNSLKFLIYFFYFLFHHTVIVKNIFFFPFS